MLKHYSITLTRIEQFVDRIGNLIYQQTEKIPMTAEVAGPVGRISYEEAQKLAYRPAPMGTPLEGIWNTYWVRLEGTVPLSWCSKQVSLFFSSHGEGLVWWEGEPLQGLGVYDDSPLKDRQVREARLPKIGPDGKVFLEVEVACNHMFGGDSDRVNGYSTLPGFILDQADLIVVDAEAFDFFHDLFVPFRFLRAQREEKMTPWRGFLLAKLNQITNEVASNDKSTWEKGREILKEIYSHKNASYASELSAIGHAHIDTAWLWPLAETQRKCTRSFSSSLRLMERYPEYKFSCSQAHQYQWMKDLQPSIYEGIKKAVKEGQWIPVGGSWIEPDCNIPSGESLVRQFLYGKRFFRKEFGWDNKEFWNPDVFGYSGALPQIMKGVGIDYFLTQKLSWNQFNKPQHQNFYWEGIDGSRVLTHFPPSDTYNGLTGDGAVDQLLHHDRNGQDHDRVKEGYLLFGYGDGGGGPTPHMIEVLRRAKDFQGLPRAEIRSSLDFFRRLEKDLVDVPVIVGELYFELHRGTYTTQAANKRDNRKCEFLLRSVEILAAVQHRNDAKNYPAAELERLWKLVLLNQFHDILPGSSIQEVYRDSARDYAEVISCGEELKEEASRRLLTGENNFTALNTSGWDRAELTAIPGASTTSLQASFRGEPLVWAQVPSIGIAPLDLAFKPEGPLSLTEKNGAFLLENRHLLVEFSASGVITRLLDKKNDREVVDAARPAGQFVIFDDQPTHWDAWDVDIFHLETRSVLPPADSAKIIENGPLRTGIEFGFSHGKSTFVQRVFLSIESEQIEFEVEVDWQERKKFLKVEFPVEVRSPEASYEIQFGQLKRPTHFNNSYDLARFEVCGHKWIDLSEPGYGVSLFTDSKYGYSVHANVMRISLLRGPEAPDPQADLGLHAFRFAVFPHTGTLEEARVVRRAYDFNNPLIVRPGSAEIQSFFQIDSPNLVIDTIKKAEDSDALIVRLYEAHGARGSAVLSSSLPFATAERVNLLEEDAQGITLEDGKVAFTYRPFEIISFRLNP